MSRRLSFVVGLALILLAGLAVPGSAQSNVSGSLQGTIKDADGGVLPGVAVTAYSDALVKGRQVAISDERGTYRFPSLPPGAYAIEAELAGFQTVRQENVRVRLGQALAVDLTMPLTSVMEQVTVSGDAPLVSVVANTVSTNFDSQFIDKQPLPRNYYSIIKSAPGVNADLSSSGSAMLAYGGTSESQNAFTLDGVNVADAGAGQHWILPSIQWMEEIQVGGLGGNAEYGGYTGGVINGVTKSGGNETHGGVEYYYEPDSWVSDNDPTTDNEKTKFTDLSISLGGPILKDKLWYFVSGEYWRQVTTPFGALDTSDRKIPRFLGKLTLQANEANRISLMSEYDNVTNDRRGISDLILAEASSKQEAPGVSVSLNWESLLNANNFVNVKVTGYDGRDDYLPYHGTTLSGRIDDGNTGTAWQNQDIRELNHRNVATLDASWSLFKDGLFGGDDSHSFKFGALYERGTSSDVWLRNGGFTYYDDSSSCDSWEAYQANPACGAYYIERGWGEYNAHPKFSGLAFYAQDSMRLDRVTLNAGLRYGSYKAGWQKGHGKSTVYDVDFIDPRLGLVWDPFGTSRTAIKAHWGRYHDKMYTYLYDREASGHAAIPDMDCYWNEDTGQYDDCDTPTYISARMGQVDHAYVDESLLTFEQQLGKDMSIGLDLMDRRFRNIMAMVNTNQDYVLITAENNPLTGGTLPIWNLMSANDFELTTKNGAYRDFQSVTARFDKRYSHGWQLRSSLVWTDLKGNVLKNNGYAPDLRDRNGRTNADGRMDYAFSEWEFKLSGAVDLPLGLQASGQYTYLSGWYYTPYVRVSGLKYNTSTGRDINLTARGSEQLPDRSLIDLRLAWGTKIGKAFKLTASLECFNVENKDTVLDVYNRWGSYNVKTKVWSKRSNYQDTYQIERPREIRASIRIEF